MTQQEKARAYDEALERAKKYNIDDAYACQGTVVKLIFPQLAESEDERIRKTLIEAIKTSKTVGELKFVFPEPTREECIAYLEKQKEQKPIKWTDLTWKDIVELEGIINHVHYEFRNGIGQESFGKEVLERFRESKGDDYVDEQKSAEYLKAERDGWYVCIKDYYRGGKKQSSVGDLVQAKGGMHIMGEKDISEWFRRAYYEEVRDAFEPNTDTNIPEKYTEWSEEDKNKIERLAFLVSVVEEKEMISPSESIDLRSFIKSLRPSWKPSEEQMEVDLEKEIEKYFKGWTETDEGIACHYQYVDLNTCRSIAHHFYELGSLNTREEE